LTPAQVKAYRLMDNRSHDESDWDLDLLGSELEELRGLDFDLSLTGFDEREIDEFLADPDADDRANLVPPVPANPAAQPGDLWVMGNHRLICGDCTQADVVAKVLGTAKPHLMATDPPYGISLDSEWRDRAGLNGCGPAEPSYLKHRTAGHTNTSISSDTRADWSEAFSLLPSLQVVYVWHASIYTREVLDGLLRIGFLYPQQIIWNKGRTVLTRTHYWYQHEPAWYLRKKNAPWYGRAGDNSTVWDSPSPKFIMGRSKEEKCDHPMVHGRGYEEGRLYHRELQTRGRLAHLPDQQIASPSLHWPARHCRGGPFLLLAAIPGRWAHTSSRHRPNARSPHVAQRWPTPAAATISVRRRATRLMSASSVGLAVQSFPGRDRAPSPSSREAAVLHPTPVATLELPRYGRRVPNPRGGWVSLGNL
jgi:hypothetical protein